MPYNSVAQALADFSTILGEENVRLDKEEAVQRQKLSATRITEAFSKISPLSDEEDARQVMLDTIADASTLETLDTSLPLIQGLYNDSTNAIRNYKAKRQDELLKGYTSKHGYDGPSQLEGTTQLKLMEYENTREERVTTTNEAGQTFLKIYDAHGKVSRQFDMDLRTDEGKFDFELRKIAASERQRAIWRDRADYVTYAGTTPEGLPISFNKQQNIFYVPYTDENGVAGMRPYDGSVIRGTKTSIDEARKSQQILRDQQKTLWVNNEGAAFDVLQRLGVSVPLDASYTKPGTSNFAKLGHMTGEERMQKMIDAEIINDAGVVQEGREEDYKAVTNGLMDFDEAYSKYEGYGDELNQTADTVSYEEGKKYAGTTGAEWNQFYSEARTVVGSTSANDEATRTWVRSQVARLRGIKESDANGMDDTAWQLEWDKMSNSDKSKIIKKLKESYQ